MEEEEVDAVRGGHHVGKRFRKNKFAVAVFDENARQEYLTGFRKRKNKRRKVADQQNTIKERQRRLQDRKERREARKAALLEQQLKGDAEDGNVTDVEELESKEDENSKVSGTTTYDDGDTTIVVTTCTLDPDETVDDVEDVEKRSQKPRTVLGKRASVPLGATQPKKAKSVNKPKKVLSEKRTKKLSRREKSVPKNQRPKKRGKKKK